MPSSVQPHASRDPQALAPARAWHWLPAAGGKPLTWASPVVQRREGPPHQGIEVLREQVWHFIRPRMSPRMCEALVPGLRVQQRTWLGGAGSFV